MYDLFVLHSLLLKRVCKASNPLSKGESEVSCTVLTLYRLNEDRLVTVVGYILGTHLICGVWIEVGTTPGTPGTVLPVKGYLTDSFSVGSGWTRYTRH